MTTAERIALAIGKILSDLHVDIETVGSYIYRTMPPLIYNRFKVIAESAEHERKMQTDQNYAREFDKIGYR
jgi:hypothetical protein